MVDENKVLDLAKNYTELLISYKNVSEKYEELANAYKILSKEYEEAQIKLAKAGVLE